MDVILVYGFTAAVVGGLDSPVGALVGGLITGLSLGLRGRLPRIGRSSRWRRSPGDRRAHDPARGDLRPPGRPGGCDDDAARPRRAVGQAVVPPARASRCCATCSSRVVGRGGLLLLSPTRLSAFNDYEVGEIAVVRHRAGRAEPAHRRQRADLPRPRRVHGRRALTPLALLVTHTTQPRARAAGRGRRSAPWPASSSDPGDPAAGPLPGRHDPAGGARPALHRRQVTTASSAGDQGLTPRPDRPRHINPEQWLAWIQLAGAPWSCWCSWPTCCAAGSDRSFRAVRDDEIAASLAGIHVARTKVIAFMVERGVRRSRPAPCSGSRPVWSTPAEFPLALSIYLLAGMVLGGPGTLGGVVGGGPVVYLPQWSPSLASDFSHGSGPAPIWPPSSSASVLIVTMLVAPTGIQGGLRWLWGQRPRPGAGSASPRQRRPVASTAGVDSNANHQRKGGTMSHLTSKETAAGYRLGYTGCVRDMGPGLRRRVSGADGGVLLLPATAAAPGAPPG